MKFVHSFLFVALAILGNNIVSAKLHCKQAPVDIPGDWISMADPCIQIMKNQVQEELTAAMTYLAMGAHFVQDSVNRPGFAKFFFESASEERQHAMKIISYLLMRGRLTTDLSDLIRDPKPLQETWSTGVDALKDALKLEAVVTRKIRDIIEKCELAATGNGDETFNDYHLVDYLSGDFLDEQYKGQRDLAGKISTLGKMMEHHQELGEFLFDKKLLNGEV